jgi:nucleobase:cation symporter-1, NCS1 family
MAETGVAMELANEEFQIETHGIDIIPESQRGGSPRRLFWIWLGGTFYVNGLVVGGLLPFLGLNLWQSLTCILLAAICTIGLGIFTVYGARYGTSTMVVGRATMGRRGQLLPTLLTWLGAVGWETVVSVVAALLISAAVTHEWPHTNTTVVEVISFIVVLGGLLLWSLAGHATILKLQKPLSILCAVLLLGLVPALLIHGHLAHIGWNEYLSPPAGNTRWASWLFAFMILMSSGCWGWTAYASEYARYLPKKTSARSIVANVFWGSNIGYTAVLLIGLLIAFGLKASDPITAVPTFLPLWYLILFVLVIVVSTWTTGVLDAYGGIYALFIYNFIGSFEEFLGLSIAWLAAWNAVILIDHFVNRRTLNYENPEDLLNSTGGRYWYRSGVSPKAFTAFILGTIAALLFLNDSPLFVGPGSKALGNADLSIWAGTIVAVVVYLVWHWAEGRQAAAVPVAVPAATTTD